MYDLMSSAPTLFKNNIYSLVDSNPSKVSKTIEGKIIESPKTILDLENPIICVTSRLFTIQDSIIKSITGLPKDDFEIANLFN